MNQNWPNSAGMPFCVPPPGYPPIWPPTIVAPTTSTVITAPPTSPSEDEIVKNLMVEAVNAAIGPAITGIKKSFETELAACRTEMMQDLKAVKESFKQELSECKDELLKDLKLVKDVSDKMHDIQQKFTEKYETDDIALTEKAKEIVEYMKEVQGDIKKFNKNVVENEMEKVQGLYKGLRDKIDAINIAGLGSAKSDYDDDEDGRESFATEKELDDDFDSLEADLFKVTVKGKKETSKVKPEPATNQRRRTTTARRANSVIDEESVDGDLPNKRRKTAEKGNGRNGIDEVQGRLGKVLSEAYKKAKNSVEEDWALAAELEKAGVILPNGWRPASPLCMTEGELIVEKYD